VYEHRRRFAARLRPLWCTRASLGSAGTRVRSDGRKWRASVRLGSTPGRVLRAALRPGSNSRHP